MTIRFGVCAPLQMLEVAACAPFDFVEAPLTEAALMEDARFWEFARRADDIPLRCEVFSNMLPEKLRVAGPDVSVRALHEYLAPAFDRAKRLGAEVILLDSGLSRSAPASFDMGQAWRQMENFLRIVQGHARQSGVRVAVCPLRRAETNLLNYVSEAMLITSLIRMDCLGVAADTYQMAMVSEPLAALCLAGSSLLHVRAANAMGNRLPRRGDGENYLSLFQTLKAAGYAGRVSCAGRYDHFAKEAAAALDVLRAALAEAEI